MARAGRRSGGGDSIGGDEESKRERPQASELPLRYNQSYGATTTYQSLETSSSPNDDEEGPMIVTTDPNGRPSPFFGGGRRLLAPAGMLWHGGVLVAVGLLCGLGVGVLIGRGGNGGMGAGSVVASVVGGGAGLPVLGNAYSPQDVDAHFTAFHFTDTHLEPLYDKDQVVKGSCRNPDCCKRGKNLCEPFTYSELEPPTLGCDPPVSLLEGTMEVMRAMDPNARYVFYTGDMPAHHLCTEELVRRTQQEFLSRVTKGLPPTMTFVYAIGNNDLFPNNKNSAHNFEALYDLMKAHCPDTCAIFQGTPKEIAENKKLFREGGYYVYRDPATSLRTLVLNSGLWSPRYDNADLPKSMPDTHMTWVKEQLQAARAVKDKVVIISHIPPGHVRHTEDWAEDYLDKYIDLCTQYSDVILAQFYGHHSKEYIRSFSPDVGVLVSAGLTPLGGGSLVFPGKDAANPTFRHAVFTKDAFYDMWSFYLDLSSGERDKVVKAEAQTPNKKAAKHATKLFDAGDVDSTVFPSSKAKSGDRAVYVNGVLQHQPGLSTRFLAAVQTANAKGWDLLYSFKETYRVPDVSPRSIHVASQRILHDSHYASRYESYLGGLHSPHRMITCDVHTRTWDSQEVEACFDRLCLYDVSQECADFEARMRRRMHRKKHH